MKHKLDGTGRVWNFMLWQVVGGRQISCSQCILSAHYPIAWDYLHEITVMKQFQYGLNLFYQSPALIALN